MKAASLLCISSLLMLCFPLEAYAATDTLIVADDVSDPATLDPQKQFLEKNHTICQQVFDGLLRFDPDGRVEPALAISWTWLDPLTVRFKLRPEVKFHNGEPFSAQAVKFSIDRYLDEKTGFPARGYIDSIMRVDIVDPLTVDIVTAYPDGLLLNRLAAFILISPPEYLKTVGEEYFATHPVGTGAFVFSEWMKGREITLNANPSYWMPGHPKIQKLVFKFLPVSKQLSAIQSGEINLITNLPGTQTRAVMENPRAAVMKKYAFRTVAVFLNFSSGPLRDVNVRKALNHALDRGELIRYDLMGNGLPIATLSMKGETGHNAKLSPYSFDLAKAKELLHKAGHENGLTLSVLAKRNTERTVKIIASQLEKVGISLRAKFVTESASPDEFKNGKYDMAIADIPDPMCHVFFIEAMGLSSQSPYSLGKDAFIDNKLHEIASTIDSVGQQEKSEKFDAYVYENALGLFTYQKATTLATSKNLHFTPYVTGMPYFFGAYFDDDKKAKPH